MLLPITLAAVQFGTINVRSHYSFSWSLSAVCVSPPAASVFGLFAAAVPHTYFKKYVFPSILMKPHLCTLTRAVHVSCPERSHSFPTARNCRLSSSVVAAVCNGQLYTVRYLKTSVPPAVLRVPQTMDIVEMVNVMCRVLLGHGLGVVAFGP